MDNYELFKTQLVSILQSVMPGNVSQVIGCIDLIAQNYEIKKRESSIVPYTGGVPEPVMLFLAAKTVEEKSALTVKLYKSVLSQFFLSVRKPIQSITTNDIRVYLFYCKTTLKHEPVTVNNTRRILNCFFEWCTLEGIAQMNPVKRITPIKTEKSPRHAMQRIELEYLRNSCDNARDKALIDFLYSTGARVSEVCHVRLSDIDWSSKSVIIRHGKGNVTRTTYLNPEAEVSLKAYLDSRKDNSPYVFTRTRGKTDKPLTAKTVQKAVDRITASTNHTFSVHITPHVFRHTVATVALKNGMPLEQVQKFLGHANVNTTLIYAEASDDDVRRSHGMYAS